MTNNKIFHICQKEDWRAAQDAGIYSPLSIETEGFIHFSNAGQVANVVNTFYKDLPDLVLLHAVIDKIFSEVKWEDSDGDVFPHVYGPLNLEAVMEVEDMIPGEDGKYSYPQ